MGTPSAPDKARRARLVRESLSAAWRLARRVLPFRSTGQSHGEGQLPPFLAVPGPCDLACAWCNFGHGAAVGFGSDRNRLRDELSALHAKGHREVGFGICHTEPTTSPDFVDIVRMARRIGFERMTLSTSGVNLARREYVEELTRAGLTKVILSMPGLDTPVSDLLLAREGASRAKLEALSNCLAAGLRTHTILMFLRPALTELPEAASRLARIPTLLSRRLLLLSGCLMDPVAGMPLQRHAVLWPSYGEVAWALRRVRRAVRGFQLYSSEMPECVRSRIPGVIGSASERKTDAWRFVKPARLCDGCTASACRGVYEGYWLSHGAPLLPEAGESSPSKPDPVALRRLLAESGGTAAAVGRAIGDWQRELQTVLESYHSGGATIADYRLASAHQEGSALVTIWESASDRMEVSIEPRAKTSRFFVAGDRFALSYRSISPMDSPAREKLLRGVLVALEP